MTALPGYLLLLISEIYHCKISFQVCGNFVFELRLIEFNNPKKHDEAGDCCDGGLIGSCDDCDPIFEGCISSKKSIQKQPDDCTYGGSKQYHFQTMEFTDTNDVNFTSIINSKINPPLKNPIVISVNQAWKVSYSKVPSQI